MHRQSILQKHRLASLNFSKNFQNCYVIRAFLFSFVVKSICLLRMLCSVPFRVQKLSSVLLSLVLVGFAAASCESFCQRLENLCIAI